MLPGFLLRLLDWFCLKGLGYQFWSGIGLSTTWLTTYWHRHNCHVKRCLRIEWHPHPNHGHPVCKKHHPDGGLVLA